MGGRIQIPKCVENFLLLMLGLLEPPRLDYSDELKGNRSWLEASDFGAISDCAMADPRNLLRFRASHSVEQHMDGVGVRRAWPRPRRSRRPVN